MRLHCLSAVPLESPGSLRACGLDPRPVLRGSRRPRTSLPSPRGLSRPSTPRRCLIYRSLVAVTSVVGMLSIRWIACSGEPEPGNQDVSLLEARQA